MGLDRVGLSNIDSSVYDVPNGIPQLNSSAALVAKTLILRALNSVTDADVVPALNEFVSISDLNQIRRGDGVTKLGVLPTPYNTDSDSIIRVFHQGTDINSGTLLQAAYTAAKSLTPGGNALSNTNRASILILPGIYDLGTSSLELDTSYIDIIGMTNDATKVVITSSVVTPNSGTIVHSADNVTISNITIDNKAAEFVLADGTDAAAYFPTQPFENVVRENVVFTSTSTQNSMRLYTEYGGIFRRCVCYGEGGFGGYGVASGTFEDCIGYGEASFAGGGLAAGSFIRCKGLGNPLMGQSSSNSCFGGGIGGVASGIFEDCVCVGDGGFGSESASGIFTRCIGGESSFGSMGYENSTNGTFYNCIGGVNSFNSEETGASGKLYYCKLTSGSFSVVGSGKTRYCLNGDDTTSNLG